MKARLNRYAQNTERRETDVFRLDLQIVNIQYYNL